MIYNNILEVGKDLMANTYLRNIGTLRFCYASPWYDLSIRVNESINISIVIFYCHSSINLIFPLESIEENINTFVDKIIKKLGRYYDLIFSSKTLSKDEFTCYVCGILFNKLPRLRREDLVVEKAFNLGRSDRFAFNLIDYRE